MASLLFFKVSGNSGGAVIFLVEDLACNLYPVHDSDNKINIEDNILRIDLTDDVPSIAEWILAWQIYCILYPAHDSRSDNNNNNNNTEDFILAIDLTNDTGHEYDNNYSDITDDTTPEYDKNHSDLTDNILLTDLPNDTTIPI